MNYIVATIHPWHIQAFEQYSDNLAGNWHLITHPNDLTMEYICTINPRYIFFPHWSWIVPEEVISQFSCVCFHMTDLPFGRGGSPLQNLIVRGIEETKVSALKMTSEIDAGPVYLKEPMKLDGTAKEIYQRVSLLITQMIETITTINPVPKEQTGKAEYFNRRTPSQSEIPSDLSSKALYNFIRMLDAPSYPKAFITRGTQRFEFYDAKLEDDTLTAKVTLINESFANKDNDTDTDTDTYNKAD